MGWFRTFELIHENRQQVLTAAESEMANLARVNQEHAERTLFSLDQSLRLVANQYQQYGDKINLQDDIEQGLIDKKLILQVSMVDAQGFLKHSSLPFKGRIDLSDHEHVRVHLGPESTPLFISHPVLGRASGKMSIQSSRRIALHNGQLGGVAVASVDPVYFTRFYDELKLGSGATAALVGTDGAIYTQKKDGSNQYGGQFQGAPGLLQDLAQGKQLGRFTYLDRAGAERLRLSPAELLADATRVSQLIHPDEVRAWRASMQAAAPERSP